MSLAPIIFLQMKDCEDNVRLLEAIGNQKIQSQ